MDFYFVSTGKRAKVEIEVIRELKPKRIMASFFYFKNLPLAEFVDRIGYKPQILLDSGAFSAWSSGKEINLDAYIRYIEENKEYIWRYITLDKLGDSAKSFDSFVEMKNRGLSPVPVFHYNGDEEILKKYIEMGETFVALGGTVPIKNKATVSEWVRLICWVYPELRFHLLGSSSKKILDYCDIESADSSTWVMAAILGRPSSVPGNDYESRKKRAIINMGNLIKTYG